MYTLVSRDMLCYGSCHRPQVSEGSGKILVVAVGDNSEWGKTISLVTSSGDEQTPLQEKLGHVAATVGKIGATVAATCFIALLVSAHGFVGYPDCCKGRVMCGNGWCACGHLRVVVLWCAGIKQGLQQARTMLIHCSSARCGRQHGC
jgi:magnesium-transporting ATPase (P-type)